MEKKSEKLIEEIILAQNEQEENIYTKKSALWKGFLKMRKGDYTKDNLLSFLDPEKKQSTGTSDYERDLSHELKDYIKSLLDSELLKSYPMPNTGSPKVFQLFGRTVSTSYLWNLSRFSVCKNMVGRHRPLTTLDILEVGAGYGAAALMWIQSGAVRSYTIIDLSENLINESYYLSENLKDWKINVCRNDVLKTHQNTINLVLPGLINKIDSLSFDLAINSDSLGEMPEPTCKEYVKWIHSHLNKAGLFFSKNGHRRGGDCVQRVGSYGYRRYSLVEFQPNKAYTGLFDDSSHLILLGKTGETLNSEQIESIETLTNLFAIGLQQDVEEICVRLSENLLDLKALSFLKECQKYFNGNDISYLGGRYDYILKYCTSLRKAVEKRKFDPGIYDYLADGKSFVAIIYSVLCLRYFLKEVGPLRKNDAGYNYFVCEIDGYEKCSYFGRLLRYLIRMDALRKKTTPWKKWKPSPIVRLKNLILNIRDGTNIRPVWRF